MFRSMLRGNSLHNQTLLLNKLSTVHKASSINSRFPCQGSAAALIGMSAVLETDGPPSRPSSFAAGPTPMQTTPSQKTF